MKVGIYVFSGVFPSDFGWIHWIRHKKARGLTPIGLGQGEAPEDTKLGWPGDWTWDQMIKLLYSCNSMLTKSWTVRHWPSVFVFSWRFERLLVLTHSWKGFPLQRLLREQHWLEKRALQLHKVYHTEHTYLITSENVSLKKCLYSKNLMHTILLAGLEVWRSQAFIAFLMLSSSVQISHIYIYYIYINTSTYTCVYWSIDYGWVWKSMEKGNSSCETRTSFISGMWV